MLCMWLKWFSASIARVFGPYAYTVCCANGGGGGLHVDLTQNNVFPHRGFYKVNNVFNQLGMHKE